MRLRLQTIWLRRPRHVRRMPATKCTGKVCIVVRITNSACKRVITLEKHRASTRVRCGRQDLFRNAHGIWFSQALLLQKDGGDT